MAGAAMEPTPQAPALHEVFAIPRVGGPPGQVRSPWTVVGLTIVTLGIYGFVWLYKNYAEIAGHTAEWPSGLVGMLLGFVPFVAMFMMPWRVGKCYEMRGMEPGCSTKTGFWGLLPIVGGIVWLFRVQNSINKYWET